MQNRREIHFFSGAEEAAQNAAEFILGLTKGKDSFSIALAGGTTPQGLYSRMASPPFNRSFPWPKMRFFLGDERWVPPSDPRSNLRMIQAALFGPAGIPVSNIFPVDTALDSPESSARDYEEKIRNDFKARGEIFRQGTRPAFDLILLGLGEDGHTASLFPGDEALREKTKWVTVSRRETPEPRITLTLPLINEARHIVFFVCGEKKRKILGEILSGPGPGFHPAGLVRPVSGALHWFIG